MQLPADGRYVLVMDGDSATPLDYSFQVNDISDAPVALSGFGSVMTGSITAGNSDDTFTFTAPAGLLAYFDSQDRDSDPLIVELCDPANNQIFSFFCTDGKYRITNVGAGTAVVREVSNTGFTQTFPLAGATSRQSFIPSGTGGLDTPVYMTFGPDGTSGAFVDVFASGGLSCPQDLTFGPDGNLYVSSELNDPVVRYTGTTGVFIDNFVPAGSGGLSNPDDTVFGPDGNAYVTSLSSDSVQRYVGPSNGGRYFVSGFRDETVKNLFLF